jgi:hypothetical protein
LTTRILFAGFEKDSIPQIASGFDVEVSTRKFPDLSLPPALLDYHIVVLDVAMIDREQSRIKLLVEQNNKTGEGTDFHELAFDTSVSLSAPLFKELIETGGIVLAFADAESSWNGRALTKLGSAGTGAVKFENNYVGKSSYSWLPVALKVVNKSGPNVYPKTTVGDFKVLSDSFREEDRNWQCYFIDCPKNSNVLFTNRAEYAIGLEVPLGKGRLVLLPRFGNVTYATKLLIEKVVLPQLGFKEQKRPASIRQSWVAKFEFSAKRKAMEDMEQARSRIEEYSNLEPLLDSSGEELRQAVRVAFSKIGFQVTQPPETKPVEDLDLAFDNWNAIVEVKGKEADANLRDLRQLLSYLVEVRDIDGKSDMNGIFVINHYSKVDAETRGKPFTPEAEDLAKKQRIMLCTSYDIYLAIGKVLEGKDSFEALRTRITQGHL